MHPVDIHALLIKCGVRQVTLAKVLNVSPVSIHNVIYARSTSRRIANAIAHIVNLPLCELWPDKYSDS